MALTDQIERRARFLQEAAHSLAVTSPAASAFLGSTRINLIDDAHQVISSKEYDALRREVCHACGSLLIPGWSCTVSIRAQLKGKAKKPKDGSTTSMKSDKSTVYDCFRCHRETTETLQPKPSRPLRKGKSHTAPDSKPALDTQKSTREDDAKVVKSINASSKQRQKARKGGLQAMLEKNKTQTSSQGGFDLMDFAM
ncbi:uncharacterized protein K460DRAFT_371179 [Cucurbitaria berberidis CBS 394.84]|uniref:Uncharacterized protein n=1 Tax=Cucurbitaria berberidis CBS 394.84 TaxID=1168544 RepID=A0A9P4G8Q3_9PLEO|nr:uncharacterized protein K460DRAFT_371179 [Cucurbitaria berberidis CBS 394.84]KAF1841173.1 hypothetical protein K460DRAFT_371179 [Cucurbitaria berberidis CBS 394.84]